MPADMKRREWLVRAQASSAAPGFQIQCSIARQVGPALDRNQRLRRFLREQCARVKRPRARPADAAERTGVTLWMPPAPPEPQGESEAQLPWPAVPQTAAGRRDGADSGGRAE